MKGCKVFSTEKHEKRKHKNMSLQTCVHVKTLAFKPGFYFQGNKLVNLNEVFHFEEEEGLNGIKQTTNTLLLMIGKFL